MNNLAQGFDAHLSAQGVPPQPPGALPAPAPQVNPPMPAPPAPAPTPAPAAVAPQPAAPPPPAAVVEPQMPKDFNGHPIVAAPWADPNCPACGGWGFDSQGKPCTICEGTCQQRTAHPPSSFSLQYHPGGVVEWRHSQYTDWVGYSWVGPSAAVALQSSEQQSAPAVQPEQPSVPAAPVATDVRNVPASPPVTAGPADSDNKSKGKSKRGRKKKTFVLCINCSPFRGQESRGDTKTTFLSQLLANEVGPELARTGGVANYTQLEENSRRNAIRGMGEKIAEGLSGVVVADGYTLEPSDMKALTDAIEPYSHFPIVPTFHGLARPEATGSLGQGAQA